MGSRINACSYTGDLSSRDWGWGGDFDPNKPFQKLVSHRKTLLCDRALVLDAGDGTVAVCLLVATSKRFIELLSFAVKSFCLPVIYWVYLFCL